MLRRLKDELSPEGVDLIAVPIDEADDNPQLAAYAKEWKPTSRLVNIAPAQRAEAVAAYTQALGQDPAVAFHGDHRRRRSHPLGPAWRAEPFGAEEIAPGEPLTTQPGTIPKGNPAQGSIAHAGRFV